MRIIGVNIPDEKRIDIALTYLYGVGHSASKKILEGAKVDPSKRAKEAEIELRRERACDDQSETDQRHVAEQHYAAQDEQGFAAQFDLTVLVRMQVLLQSYKTGEQEKE